MPRYKMVNGEVVEMPREEAVEQFQYRVLYRDGSGNPTTEFRFDEDDGTTTVVEGPRAATTTEETALVRAEHADIRAQLQEAFDAQKPDLSTVDTLEKYKELDVQVRVANGQLDVGEVIESNGGAYLPDPSQSEYRA